MTSKTLYFRDGSSDKVYIANIVPNGDGFDVTFQYGRRGATLASGTKNAAPVDLATAEKLFAKLVKEKQAKGYAEGEGATPFSGADTAGRVSGVLPQLLNAIDDRGLAEKLNDPSWIILQKFDGERRFVCVENGTASGINRNGLTVALPVTVAEAAQAAFGAVERTVIDGEQVGDAFFPFDLLEFNGTCVRHASYAERLSMLCMALDVHGRPFPAPLHFSGETAAKKSYLASLRAERAEGVVFKDKNAPYSVGRPASGGPALKFKFVASATVQVGEGGREGKRSFPMLVRGADGAMVAVGNCTVPANVKTPVVSGTFVEVEYLYAYKGGALYQPVYKQARADKDCADTHDSLQFKAEASAAA